MYFSNFSTSVGNYIYVPLCPKERLTIRYTAGAYLKTPSIVSNFTSTVLIYFIQNAKVVDNRIGSGIKILKRASAPKRSTPQPAISNLMSKEDRQRQLAT